MWQEIFGRGHCKNIRRFWNAGELPSHPELLDWLAVDFMEHGWDIKRLVKQIVMSATYRQSAKVTEEKLEKDPENVYLSRGPRIRLPAEFVRDIVLSSSGLLVRTIGGPSVKPYQPKGFGNRQHQVVECWQLINRIMEITLQKRHIYIYQTHRSATIDDNI